MQFIKHMPWFHRLAIIACGLLIAVVTVLPKADTQGRTQIELASIAPLSSSLQPSLKHQQPWASRQDKLESGKPFVGDGPSKDEGLRSLVFTVERGETLSHLFDRAKLSPAILFRILGSAPNELERRLVRNLQPGNTFEFHMNKDEIQGFTLWFSRMEGLHADIEDNRKISHWETFTRDSIREVEWARGTINSSLFFAGRDSGLSETMTMNLAQLFGWDIDFALDIRQGDHFALLYEKLYFEGEFIGEGNILAA
ncbi:MAG: hypothetical protein WED11_13645, partial [Natronospirillum sp.]